MPKEDDRKAVAALAALTERVESALAELRRREKHHEHGDRTKSESYSEGARLVEMALRPPKPKYVETTHVEENHLNPKRVTMIELSGTFVHVEEKPMNQLSLFGNKPFEATKTRILWRIIVAPDTARERILELAVEKVGLTWAAFVMRNAIGNAYSSPASAVVGIERFVTNELEDAADIMGVRDQVDEIVSGMRLHHEIKRRPAKPIKIDFGKPIEAKKKPKAKGLVRVKGGVGPRLRKDAKKKKRSRR